VACILREDDVVVPRGSTRVQIDDHLIVISHPQNEKRDFEVLCGEPGS
jgi:Trk K+ transport system NAD-binding subunit